MPISPALVQKLGLRVKQRKVQVAFCQLDGSIAGVASATFVTESIEMGVGAHMETLNIIVVSGTKSSFVLDGSLYKLEKEDVKRFSEWGK